MQSWNAACKVAEYVRRVWSYTSDRYGKLTPERVYGIFHQNKYFGSHAFWLDADRSGRSGFDCGGNWRDGQYE